MTEREPWGGRNPFRTWASMVVRAVDRYLPWFPTWYRRRICREIAERLRDDARFYESLAKTASPVLPASMALMKLADEIERRAK